MKRDQQQTLGEIFIKWFQGRLINFVSVKATVGICRECWLKTMPRYEPLFYTSGNATEICNQCNKVICERDIVWFER